MSVPGKGFNRRSMCRSRHPDDCASLGSGGWIPTPSRATCSALLREGDHALVIDAGTGISHLVTTPDLLEGVSTIDIVLTHFHLDHIVGLAYLPALSLVRAAARPRPGRLALLDADS